MYVNTILCRIYISNAGRTLDLSAGTVNVASLKTLTIAGGNTLVNATGSLWSGPGTVNVNGGTLTITGNVMHPAGTGGTKFRFGVASTIAGTGTLTNSAGGSLNLNSDTVNAALVNNGTLTLFGSTINGAFSNNAGGTINQSFAGSTIANGFTNNGTINFNTLTITVGALTNAGAINGTAVNSTLNAAVVNTGAIIVNKNTSISGLFSSPAGASSVNGNGSTLSLNGGVNVDGMTVDNALLAINGTAPARFDNITFRNYAVTATPLLLNFINATGTFNNLQFLQLPTTGKYISVAGAGNTITVAGVGRKPLYGIPKTSVATGSTLLWGAITDNTDGDAINDATEMLFNSDPVLATSLPAVQLIGQTDSLGVAHANAVFDAGGSNDTNPYGLNTTEGMDIDPVGHRLFVADRGQNRILAFQLNALNHIASRKAVAVLGQADFEHADTDRGGAASANTLDSPNDVSYYNDGVNKWLLVADRDNNRLLIYNITAGVTNGMNAVNVLGQTTFAASGFAINQSTFHFIRGVKVATVGTQTILFASDGANDRVLGWNITAGGLAALTNGQAADYVLGQPNFTTNGTVRNQSSLDDPKGMALWNNILFVADYVNDRVLGFDLGVNAANLITTPQGMAASHVLGQPNFTTNGVGVTRSSLNGPTFAAVDGNYLFVSDWVEDRVVVYNLALLANGMNAAYVYGQANFTANLGAVGQNRLNGPDGLAVAPGQWLFVGEDVNDRVVSYNLATLAADITNLAYGPNAANVIGQSNWAPGTPDGNETGLFDANGSSDVGAVGVKSPGDSVLGSVQGTNYLFVADAGNSRVLAFATDANGAPLDLQADFVLGQADFDHVAATTTASSLRRPTGVAFDAATSRLFVSDELDDRIVIYDLSAGIGNGMAASLVLGQTTFTGHFSGRSSTRVNTPKRMAVGTVGGVKYLFVADNLNGRVLMFNISGVITNSMAASFVLGAANFNVSGTVASQSEMEGPSGLDFDQATGRLFVVDGPAHRIMVWDLSSGVVTNGMAAANVIGQTTFGSTLLGTTASKFSSPVDAAFDSSRNILWVSDYNNNRLLGFDLGAGITNGMSAGFVIGQPDFVTSAARTEEKVPGVTTGRERDGFALERPFGIHVSSGGHLYVPEDFGDRLVIY
jgi:sugar lactone lactonase YvrE